MGIENINTALNTKDEVISALARSGRGRVLFVKSPDHLPRVACDALAAGGLGSVFVAWECLFRSMARREFRFLSLHKMKATYSNAAQCRNSDSKLRDNGLKKTLFGILSEASKNLRRLERGLKMAQAVLSIGKSNNDGIPADKADGRNDGMTSQA